MATQLEAWLQRLPATVAVASRDAAGATALASPLYRCLEREARTGSKVLKRVREDVELCVRACRGEEKATNHVRTLMADIGKGA
jgi:dynein heavy chain 1